MEKKEHEQVNTQIAICCCSLYQILNAINLACNSLPEKWEKDLYVRTFSKEMECIADRIQKYNIFSNIYKVNYIYDAKTIGEYWNSLTQAVMPRKYIQNLLPDSINLLDKKYKYTTITGGRNPFEVAMTRVFPMAETIACEDGLGSYAGDIIHDYKLKLIWRILGRNPDRIHPVELYVNNVEFCKSTEAKTKKQLMPLTQCSSEYIEMLFDIFSYRESNLYSIKQFVYLTQPWEQVDSLLPGQMKRVHDVLKKYTDKGIIRIHPHDKTKYNLDLSTDEENNIWELICYRQLKDSHILIGMGSTAQITPKLMYNKEPWLIFLYDMFRYSDKRNTEIKRNNFKIIAKRIQKIYSDKKKIIIPKNTIELERALNIILYS